MIHSASLAAFQAVLQTGSFEGAAAQLGLSQPAISARIKGLEERLGTALIRRTRPARPPKRGAAFWPMPIRSSSSNAISPGTSPVRGPIRPARSASQ